PPAIIEVDIMVRSMGPISEMDTYSMDCYFRQSWVDRRLAFQGNKETLALSISMLQRIWKPDTYFYNGKHSYLHTITTPNKFVRLYQDGRVLYSSRLTIKAGCRMNLEDFPMDVQRCPLKFGSFGYTTNDVVYRWNTARQVAIAEDMKLSQFDLIATPSANQTDILQSDSSSVNSDSSRLVLRFPGSLHLSLFFLQVKISEIMPAVTCHSETTNRSATDGITTVLTMTFLGLEARTDLPKVPYPTALDFFVFLSFAFIFATIIQFAVVHYFTKYGSGECYFILDLSSDSSSDDEEWNQGGGGRRADSEEQAKGTSGSARGFLNTLTSPNGNTGTNNHLLEVIPLSACQITPATISSNRTSHYEPWSIPSCLECTAVSETESGVDGTGAIVCSPTVNTSNIRKPSVQGQIKRKRKKRTPRYNSVSKIDRASRIVFPMCFLAINAFYWYSYLSRSKRIQHIRSGDTL
ncbi:hypothetical protein Cfor_01961, partial [Coptotermes formosanus]